mmetsp:Transcript_13457/g.32085  ORF Transcript_13457/g.32085 Transcript_13457/m.32085 type:complete len:251 (+) Transcript_13457:1959-2711(+)
MVLLLEGGRQKVGEDAQREGQRELHERHQHEEGERDDAREVGEHADEQVVLAPREAVAEGQSLEEARGDRSVGHEELGAVVVVQQHLLPRGVEPRGRPFGRGGSAAAGGVARGAAGVEGEESGGGAVEKRVGAASGEGGARREAAGEQVAGGGRAGGEERSGGEPVCGARGGGASSGGAEAMDRSEGRGAHPQHGGAARRARLCLVVGESVGGEGRRVRRSEGGEGGEGRSGGRRSARREGGAQRGEGGG